MSLYVFRTLTDLHCMLQIQLQQGKKENDPAIKKRHYKSKMHLKTNKQQPKIPPRNAVNIFLLVILNCTDQC